jgi:hypothetical protein
MAAVLLTPALASLGDGVPAVVHYVDHEKVAATFIKGGNLVTDPGLIVAAARRGPGLSYCSSQRR